MAQDVMGTLGIYTFVIKVIGVSVRSVMVSVTRCTMKVFFCCAYEAKAGLECAFCDLCFFRIKAWWWKESVNFFDLIMTHTQKF